MKHFRVKFLLLLFLHCVESQQLVSMSETNTLNSLKSKQKQNFTVKAESGTTCLYPKLVRLLDKNLKKLDASNFDKKN